MNQKSSVPENSGDKTPRGEPQEDRQAAAELEELKRDMRSAQVIAWARANQQQLIAAAVVLVMLLVAGGFWLEHERAQRTSAATLYHQAVSSADKANRKSLLEKITRDYGDTAYGALALMHLAQVDSEHAEMHLQALINHPAAMPEWIWQARLDLAEIYLQRGDAQAARSILQAQMGKRYEQLRHYLLALSAGNTSEKTTHLQQALDAVSTDADLKRKIEMMLAEARAAAGASKSQ